MDFLQVFLSQLKEVLPICLILSVSMWGIYFSIRFLKNMFIHQGCYFSNPFEDSRKDTDINLKKSNENQNKDIVIPADKPYKINLSKYKSGE